MAENKYICISILESRSSKAVYIGYVKKSEIRPAMPAKPGSTNKTKKIKELRRDVCQ